MKSRKGLQRVCIERKVFQRIKLRKGLQRVRKESIRFLQIEFRQWLQRVFKKVRFRKKVAKGAAINLRRKQGLANEGKSWVCIKDMFSSARNWNLAGYRRPEWAPEARQERPQSAAVPPPASISLGHPSVSLYTPNWLQSWIWKTRYSILLNVLDQYAHDSRDILGTANPRFKHLWKVCRSGWTWKSMDDHLLNAHEHRWPWMNT